MPVVATHRVRPTDVLASDIWSPTGSMLCAKGTLCSEQIVQRLLHFAVDMVHVEDRGELPENVTAEQAAEYEAAVEQRFTDVQGDKFLMRLKNAVLTTIMSQGPDEQVEEPEFDLSTAQDADERQQMILAEMNRLKEREATLDGQLEKERRFASERQERLRQEIADQIESIKRDADLRTTELMKVETDLAERRAYLEHLLKMAQDPAVEVSPDAAKRKESASRLRCLAVLEDPNVSRPEVNRSRTGSRLRTLQPIKAPASPAPEAAQPKQRGLRCLQIMDEPSLTEPGLSENDSASDASPGEI